MQAIINAVLAMVNSIKVDIELYRLAKELDRKGQYIIDPRRIRVSKDTEDAVEGYTITKGGVSRDIAVGYDKRVVVAEMHRACIKAALIRNGYHFEKVYITATKPVVGKPFSKFTVTPRTMGE